MVLPQKVFVVEALGVFTEDFDELPHEDFDGEVEVDFDPLNDEDRLLLDEDRLLLELPFARRSSGSPTNMKRNIIEIITVLIRLKTF